MLRLKDEIEKIFRATYAQYLEDAQKNLLSVGSSTVPVYFLNGVPTAITLATPVQDKLLSWDGTAFTWVNKPTSNVTTSAVLSSVANGSTHIQAEQADPYYNLIEGSQITRSIQFKAGAGMEIKTTIAGVITFKNTSLNVWKPATTSQEGYVPILALSSTDTIQDASTEYVLTYKAGTDNSPYWRRLPSNAYSNTVPNDGLFKIQSKIGNNNPVVISDFGADQASNDDITFIQGTNITFTNDTINRTLQISATDTTYKLKLNNTNKGDSTNGTDLGTFYAPSSAGTGFLKGTSDGNGNITWSWDNSTYNNYSLSKATSSELGGVIISNALTTAVTLTSGNGSMADRYYGVQIDKNGKIFVNIPWENTHYTASLILGGSDATINASSDTTNTTTYLNVVENNAKSGGIQIKGSGGTSVSAKNGILTIDSANTKYYYLTLNGTVNGDNNTTNLGTIYAPSNSGTGFLKSSVNNGVVTWSYDNSTYLTSHYTAVPILGEENDTSNSSSSTSNTTTYLNIIENSTKSGGVKITGSGGTTVNANGGVLTITSPSLGTGASNAAKGNHTHTLTLGTDSGTSTVDLTSNTVYKLTAGGKTLIFKTPVDSINVTSALYFGASNGTGNSQVAQDPYLIFMEGSSPSRYKFEGAGGITVSSDSNGNLTFTGTTYSFSNLSFKDESNNELMTYNSQDTRTIKSGDNIKFDSKNGILTISATDTTYTFQDLVFRNQENTQVGIYRPATSPGKTIKAGSNITISASDNVITLAGTPDTTYKLTINKSTNGDLSGVSLGDFYAPTSTGTGFLKGTAGENNTITWSWDNATYLTSHYTAVPVLGASGATSNASSDTNDPYLGIVENLSQSGQVQIKGSGGTTVKANNGILTISSTTVRNNKFSIKSKIGNNNSVVLSDFTANQSSDDDFTLIQGSNITFTNDTTNRTLTIAGTPDTTYKLYINTAANSTNATTLLNETSTTTGYIVTESAYNASTNKIATMTDVTTATTSMFQFKGNATALPSGTVNVGYSYKVSQAFTLATANSASGRDEVLEPGDLLVCTDATIPKYLVLNTNWAISIPNSNTLSTSATTIATVGGQEIKATLPIGAKDVFGVVKTSSTISDTSGLTASPIINGIVYYKNTTYSFYDLAFKSGNTVIDTYKPSTSPSKTLLAGSNITLSAENNIITIAATDTTYDIATSSSAGLVKVGDTLTSAYGYTAVKIKDGVIYYHDTLYNFYNLHFQESNGTDLMNYNSQAEATVREGSNITFSFYKDVLTIAAIDTWKAATTSQEGYVPQLSTTAGTIASSDQAYVLTYTSGIRNTTTPVWKALPANAYNNTWTALSSTSAGYAPQASNGTASASTNTYYFLGYTGETVNWYQLPANAFLNTWIAWQGATSNGNGTAGYMPAPTSNDRLKYLRGDGTWQELNNYALIAASTTSLGGIIASNVLSGAVTLTSTNGSTTGRYYGVQVDNTGKAFVNIPWTDTLNTTGGDDSSSKLFLVGMTAQTTNNGTARTYTQDTAYIGDDGCLYSNSTKVSVEGHSHALADLTNWAQTQTTSQTISSVTISQIYWPVAPTNSNQVYGIGIRSNGLLYYVYNNKGTISATSYSNNSNTWRNVYLNNSSVIGTGTGTKAINFVAGSNVSLEFKTYGTGENESGSSNYFNIEISAVDTWNAFTAATSETDGTAGYIQAHAGDQNKFFRGDNTWQNLTSNVTTALYVGASNGTSTSQQTTNGNVYLILAEGDNYTRYNITGSGRTTVKSSSTGAITIDTPVYSSFTAATSSAAGAAGLVPAPGTTTYNKTTYFLRSDATWQALGSNAFNSTDYLPLSGDKMTGSIYFGAASTCYGSNGIRFYKTGTTESVRFGADTNGGAGIYATGSIYLRPNVTLGATSTNGLVISSNSITYNNNTVYHSGNIPSNSATTAGIVAAPSAAGKVYMTVAGNNNTYSPQWTTIDTTVTSSSSNLVTSGAVATAIANNVAGAVQYLGTVTSSNDLIALTTAGFGDFARVLTSFQFTDATGSSVVAHVGDIVYLTSNDANAYATASNWIVAHTEVDTDTWVAASTSAAGYVPKLELASSNTIINDVSSDYVLSYKSGTSTTPSWRKLPVAAFASNTWRTICVDGTAKLTGSTATGSVNFTGGGTVSLSFSQKTVTQDYSTITISSPQPDIYVGSSSGTNNSPVTSNPYLIFGIGSSYTRKQLTGANGITISSDSNGNLTFTGTTYSVFSGVNNDTDGTAGLVPAPIATSDDQDKFLKGDGTWATVNQNVTTALYIGEENASQSSIVGTTGSVYLTLNEGGTTTSYQIQGGGGTSVSTSFASNKYKLNISSKTYSLTINGTENGDGRGTSLGTIYAPTEAPTSTGTYFIKCSQSKLGTSIFYDDEAYLPLSGGAMTGPIIHKYTTANPQTDQPFFNIWSQAQDVWLWRVNNYNGTTIYTSGKAGYGLKYIGSGSGSARYLQLLADNYNDSGTHGTQVTAITIDQAGNINIGASSTDSTYRAVVTGSLNVTGTIYQSGTAVSLTGHTHSYSDLNGSTNEDANKAILTDGTGGWKLTALGSAAFESADNTFTMSRAAGNLSQNTWTTVGTFANSTTSGAYVVQFTVDGTTYSGLFSYNSSDTLQEEIGLHAAGTSARRLYARVNGTNFQIITDAATFSMAATTFNFRKLI